MLICWHAELISFQSPESTALKAFNLLNYLHAWLCLSFLSSRKAWPDACSYLWSFHFTVIIFMLILLVVEF